METFIDYLERMIEGCDNIGGMEKEKATYQSILKMYRDRFDISINLSRLKIYLEVNAGRLCEPLLKQGKNPKDDPDCHKAFLMLAHLQEIDDYLNGS